MDAKPPSARRAGARIRVKSVHAEEAAQRFRDLFFEPIYREQTADGDVEFWFDKTADAAKLAFAIPPNFYAFIAIVGKLS